MLRSETIISTNRPICILTNQVCEYWNYWSRKSLPQKCQILVANKIGNHLSKIRLKSQAQIQELRIRKYWCFLDPFYSLLAVRYWNAGLSKSGCWCYAQLLWGFPQQTLMGVLCLTDAKMKSINCSAEGTPYSDLIFAQIVANGCSSLSKVQ
jgi:hypothetical protein